MSADDHGEMATVTLMVDALILREVAVASAGACAAYLAGAAHDGTISRLHRTLRMSQAVPGWLEVLQAVRS